MVVPSVHPAYCLRNGDAFPDLIRDVEKLYRDMPPWSPPDYVVADDPDTALRAIDMIRNDAELHITQDDGSLKRVLVFDIECGIDKDNDYDHPDRYEMLCIGICYAKGKVVVFGERVMQDKMIIAALAQLLKESLLSAHNGKFDCAGVYPIMGEILLWFDTMLAHYCIDERPGHHKLGMLGPEILGTPNWKGAINKYLGTGKNYAAIPRPELYKYNAYDDAATWDLMEYFLVKLERLGLRGLHDFLVDASNQLKFPELNGITVNRNRNIELTDYYLGILAELREGIDKIVQDPGDEKSDKDYDKYGGLNPNSPKQVKKYLWDHKLRVPSTEADVLERLAERVDADSNVGRFLSLLLEHRLKAKRHGTYVKGIRNRMYRGRVYTSYLLHGTTSGRLASRNPNLQNIVRDPAIKSQFSVSKLGNVFVAADYQQAEGRVICTLAQDEYLAGIFRNPDRDLFDELGMGLYPGQTSFTKDERVRTKAYFYGLGYGREAFSIAQEYRLPVSEVEEGLQKFFKLIPGVVKWQTAIKQQVLDGKDLITTFGRHRRFYLITDENRKDVLNEALSFLPQSISSDICLRAFIRLRPRLRGKAFIRLLIHDSITAECKEEDKDYVAEVIREEMIRSAEEWTTYVPFGVDISFGKNWGELG
jgi:DNA polymerase I-like protein with 3'-5' exonuclease and polymerase domains